MDDPKVFVLNRTAKTVYHVTWRGPAERISQKLWVCAWFRDDVGIMQGLTDSVHRVHGLS